MIRRSLNTLWLRLALAFLTITLLVIAAVAILVNASVESSFGAYVNVSNLARFGGDLVHELETYFAQNGTWSGVETLLPGRGGQGGTSGSGFGGWQGVRGAQIFIADVSGKIVAATQSDWIGQAATEIGPSRQIALYAAGQMVGALGEQTPGTLAINEAENQFLQETTNGLFLTGIIAGTVALVLGAAFSYTMTRPLQHLTEAISRWQLRRGGAPLPLKGTGEIQRLGAAFNDLLTRLAEGEVQRQRMSADVAHELRTPVTVMRGHLEAMMDGVYPLDVVHLAVAYDQALHLAQLVEDLRLLTLAEAGRLSLNLAACDLNAMISAAVERFALLTQDQEIQVVAQLVSGPAIVQADPHRIQQVLDNLLNNAIRHTPRLETISVRVIREDQQICVHVSNPTQTNLSDDQVAHLFDRFWRGEEARQRDTGGSGLGLAITRELLRVHGGDIHAERDRHFLRFVFHLPVKD